MPSSNIDVYGFSTCVARQLSPKPTAPQLVMQGRSYRLLHTDGTCHIVLASPAKVSAPLLVCSCALHQKGAEGPYDPVPPFPRVLVSTRLIHYSIKPAPAQ